MKVTRSLWVARFLLDFHFSLRLQGVEGVLKVVPMNDKREFSDEELKERLTPEQYQVTQKAGTEPAFSGIYNDCKDAGTYRCIVCDDALFASDTKYDSGSGWPSFWKPVTEDAVSTVSDRKFGMRRVEVLCGSCGAHLGHVFPDGPAPTGDRYCMNSASLRLDRSDVSE